ncbi:MAG: Stp1/IreP family PP2C-type Ser/Thr phosphatase [Bacilli bacterium]|nr:Stp1/IreP family PP2C-type Ser/Thr phosphatase [Bacilli bacterium]
MRHGSYAFKTDIGMVRTHNDDKAQVAMNVNGEVFLVVCDGMGGANKGDLASQIAIETLVDAFRHKRKHHFAYTNRNWFTKAAKKANAAIYEYAENNPDAKGMGTTLVCALISDNRLYTCCIGDSRCYMLIKKNALKQLTEDQTYVNFLLSTGKITEDEAVSHPDRHVLMNALGIFPSLSLAFNEFDYQGETILCCSDGLYNQVPVDEIANILSTDERCDQKADSLIAIANSNGGSDNIAIALWECISND